MKQTTKWMRLMVLIPLLTGCASVPLKQQAVESPASKQAQIEAQQLAQLPKAKKYKRKIVIGRFSNETNYGRTILSDDNYDRVGKQVSDMLASRLVKSNRFIVLERPDLNKVQAEQLITNDKDLVGADTIIFGSVTEFGRSVTGKAGFLSATKMQTAKAKVEIRLVDSKTGQAFFSATGAGEANTESGEMAGFGSQADYDATLNDRAIAAAVSDVINNLIISMENRPWKSDILQIQGQQIFISGGKYQGLKEGDVLFVMKKTGSAKSKQSGFTIDLPPEKIASIKVVSFFGDNETNEGAIAQLVDGSIAKNAADNLFVKEGE